MKTSNPLRVDLRPSCRLAWLLGTAHGGAALLLPALPLPLWMKLLMAGLLLASAAHAVALHALRRGDSAVTAIELADREQLKLLTGDGLWLSGRLLGSSTVSIGLTLLNIRLDRGGIRHVLITGDGIDADDYRRLRVWLRWGPRPAGEDAEPV